METSPLLDPLDLPQVDKEVMSDSYSSSDSNSDEIESNIAVEDKTKPGNCGTEFSNASNKSNSLENGQKLEPENPSDDALQLSPERERKTLDVEVKNEKIISTENSKIMKKGKIPNKQTVYVHVQRTKEMQEKRLLLPILAEEQSIMELISENDIIVICGSTGSGKTTQIPQFLYEAGYASHKLHEGIIGVTEPRRVAAVSMSKRVADEMNLSISEVSYQIRYEQNTTDKTKIKFMTDGVLLKEIIKDFYLPKYSALIIDEAHERSVFTDILIGLLSRVVPLRRKQNKPLKLVIMSATLRVEDFTANKSLFTNPPPVFSVDSRQYPVTIHFNKHTYEDYITQAFKKVCKIHKTLGVNGGILVFLTGQNEVLSLCRKLKKTFPYHSSSSTATDTTQSLKQSLKDHSDNFSWGVDEDDEDYDDDYDGDSVISDTEIHDEGNSTSEQERVAPLHVLPLYSALSSDQQAKVFMDVPNGSRLCVVATNVAETSLTIPGIKYIVDSGKVKKKFYDKRTGVSTFRIVWTSKASANQRAGRAGRTEPGHCYRLFSSAVFNNEFEEFSEPEICQRPVEDLVLQMKSMYIDKVINFPFPSPPSKVALQAAEDMLVSIGALKQQHGSKGDGKLNIITSLGKKISQIPVLPRFGKMIWLASKFEGCLKYVISIVAALTVKEIFTDDISILEELQNEEELDSNDRTRILDSSRRKWAGKGIHSLLGDMMVILRAVGACQYAGYDEKFCKKNGLRFKAMIEVKKLRGQLIKSVDNLLGGKTDDLSKMEPPNSEQALRIRQIMLSCFGDRVARKMSSSQAKELKLKNAYQCCSSDDPVYIHPKSSLFTKLPEFVVYNEILETSKLYMKDLIVVEESWLPVHAKHMCSFSKPLDSPPPSYIKENDTILCYRTSKYGPHLWNLSPQLVDYPECAQYYHWFAYFLLKGDVMDSLKTFSHYLVSPPSIIVKSFSQSQVKVNNLVSRLLHDGISNRKKLILKWNANSKYLLDEYLMWLPSSFHRKVKNVWPPT